MLEEIRPGKPCVDRNRSGASETMIREIYRMTPRQFRKAIDAGVFGERHVELLGGIPFIMSEKPPHILASLRVYAALIALVADPRWVRQQGAPSGAGPVAAAP